MTEIQKKNKVDKHYNLIEAKYKMGVTESKIVLSIISLIRASDEDFMSYQIPLSSFKFLYENDNGRRLKKYCENIMLRPMTIKQKDGGWLMFHWFSHIQYNPKERMLECGISPKLKPYLLQMKGNYKSYSLKYILQMQSEYSIRIYEILKKHEQLGYAILNLEDLHETLEVPKSFKDKYCNFKRKVLHTTIAEIAKLTDIWFEFEEIKHQKKVVELKFIIHKNKHNLIEEEDYEFMKFRKHIISTYEGHQVIFHPKIDRHIIIKNSLLVIAESNTIINSKRALELWKFIYKNKDQLLKLP